MLNCECIIYLEGIIHIFFSIVLLYVLKIIPAK